MVVNCRSSFVVRPPSTVNYSGGPNRGMQRWFPSGYGFRRWAAVLALGVAILALGTAMAITNMYRLYILDHTGTTFLYYTTLQFIPRPYREILVALVGVALTIWGAIGIS